MKICAPVREPERALVEMLVVIERPCPHHEQEIVFLPTAPENRCPDIPVEAHRILAERVPARDLLGLVDRVHERLALLEVGISPPEERVPAPGQEPGPVGHRVEAAARVAEIEKVLVLEKRGPGHILVGAVEGRREIDVENIGQGGKRLGQRLHGEAAIAVAFAVAAVPAGRFPDDLVELEQDAREIGLGALAARDVREGRGLAHDGPGRDVVGPVRGAVRDEVVFDVAPVAAGDDIPPQAVPDRFPSGIVEKVIDEVIGEGDIHSELADRVINMLPAALKPGMEPWRFGAQLDQERRGISAGLSIFEQGVGQGVIARSGPPSADPDEPRVDRPWDIADERLVLGEKIDIEIELVEGQGLPGLLGVPSDLLGNALETVLEEAFLYSRKPRSVKPEPRVLSLKVLRGDEDCEFRCCDSLRGPGAPLTPQNKDLRSSPAGPARAATPRPTS